MHSEKARCTIHGVTTVKMIIKIAFWSCAKTHCVTKCKYVCIEAGYGLWNKICENCHCLTQCVLYVVEQNCVQLLMTHIRCAKKSCLNCRSESGTQKNGPTFWKTARQQSIRHPLMGLFVIICWILPLCPELLVVIALFAAYCWGLCLYSHCAT